MTPNSTPARDEPAGLDIIEVETHQGTFSLGPISLRLDPGRLCMLLGANGSGKTTLMRTILGQVVPSKGSISILGTESTGERPSPQVLRQIGHADDVDSSLIGEFTARETWELAASLYARVDGNFDDLMASALEMADYLDLDPGKKPVKSFSRGMKQKTMIIVAMMHRPKVLLLDEPANGLDPVVRHRFENLIAELKESGTSILMASHDLRWAADVGDDVVILSAGQLVANGSPESVSQGRRFDEVFFELVGADDPIATTDRGDR